MSENLTAGDRVRRLQQRLDATAVATAPPPGVSSPDDTVRRFDELFEDHRNWEEDCHLGGPNDEGLDR